MNAALKPYPGWVCTRCALAALELAGTPALTPRPRVRLLGACRVCGEVSPVCCPRHYGWPRFEGFERP